MLPVCMLIPDVGTPSQLTDGRRGPRKMLHHPRKRKAAPTRRMQKRSFRHGRLSSQVAQQLEEMIAESLLPGKLLPAEKQLSSDYGVSRIVIREAMKMLEDRGVVEVRAGRGTMVLVPNGDRVKASLTRLLRKRGTPILEEMNALLELREVLEESAAALAAVRATAKDLTTIETALGKMKQGVPSSEVLAADLEFHLAVARAARNPFFEMILQPLTEVFLQQIQITGQRDVGWAGHNQIYQAIRDRDPVAARVQVRQLLRRTRTDIERILSPKKPTRQSE
jgi:GntR family transcriptional repressor for pyruvate dehydrogenase complex